MRGNAAAALEPPFKEGLEQRLARIDAFVLTSIFDKCLGTISWPSPGRLPPPALY